MLTSLGVSKEETDKILLLTVWPFLSKERKCENPNCATGSHPRFQEEPKECWSSGMTSPPQYDSKIQHLFKEDLEVGNIEELLKNMVSENQIEEETWTKLLIRHTTLSCGVLYDTMAKKFVLLGQDQLNLYDSPEHYIMEPKIIEGLAGTGKTITIAAKLEKLFKEGEISGKHPKDPKAVYICFSSQMVQQMKLLLDKSNVNMKNITIVNSNKFKNSNKNQSSEI